MVQSSNEKRSKLKLKAGEKIKDMDHGDLEKSGFWISQLFVVLATIVGVYLAANAGLKQAIIFDSITSQENNYYLRVSLHDELQDNVNHLRTYVDETLSGNPSQTVLENQRPKLSQFVWETMRYSSSTLETPSLFLTEGRRFYTSAEDILQKAENRIYGATHAAALLTAVLDKMEQDTLPKLQANYRALGDGLKEQGVNIDLLKEAH